MKIKISKYFSIIFILAIFMGVFHHHNDLKQHPDCKICILQSNITNADTPIDVVYIQNIFIKNENISTYQNENYRKKLQNSSKARAPPEIS